MNLRSILNTTLLIMLVATSGAAEEFRLVGTEVHELTSERLSEPVSVAVALPFGYRASTSQFPLLLALDGDVMFGMSAEIPRLLSFEGKVPPMIVATVAYGDLNTWIQKRQVDFHPGDGGAEQFLAALEEVVMPFLKAQYRVNNEAVGLYGHSSAGLFALFAGITAPELFTHILATSPSLEEEPVWAKSFLPLIAGAPVLPKFFLSSDVSEQAVHAALAPSLSALRQKVGHNRVEYQRVDTGGHMASIPASYVSGLHFLFAPAAGAISE